MSRRKFSAETEERSAPTNVGGYFFNGLSGNRALVYPRKKMATQLIGREQRHSE